jgi:intracellular sulfur oxidation DsrE/DsrF family protein
MREHSSCEVTMSRPFVSILLALSLLPAAAFASDGFWQTPTIAGAGKIHALPQAAYQPDRNATYKVVFSLSKAGDKPDEVSPSLDHVARAVNLYVSAGVPLDHLKFVAIASGASTPIVLNDAQYQKLYGVANPNLPLIEQLRKAGVDIAVCGQAVAEHKFQYDWVDSHVTLALSALTTVTVLEQQGYALMPL